MQCQGKPLDSLGAHREYEGHTLSQDKMACTGVQSENVYTETLLLPLLHDRQLAIHWNLVMLSLTRDDPRIRLKPKIAVVVYIITEHSGGRERVQNSGGERRGYEGRFISSSKGVDF